LVKLEGIPGSGAARERGEGFDSAIAGEPCVKLVAKQPASFDRAQGLSVMENILQGNKDIQGVFAQNDEMAWKERSRRQVSRKWTSSAST
jgi:ribose transport system substrate-binding protein